MVLTHQTKETYHKLLHIKNPNPLLFSQAYSLQKTQLMTYKEDENEFNERERERGGMRNEED